MMRVGEGKRREKVKFKPFTREVHNYALYGAMFGLMFPIFGTLLHAAVVYGGVGMSQLVEAQSTSALLWIIDTAPLFLGLFAAFGGAQLDRVRDNLHRMEELKNTAERANRTKGHFLANMSHEVRTPLNAIIGMTHLLARSELRPKQRDYTEKLGKASQTLLTIVNDILDLSKIEAGRVEVENIDFKLPELVQNVTDIVNARMLEKPDVEFHIKLQPDVPMSLIGDAMRLQQVLVNLLANAVKFTSAGDVVLGIRVTDTADDDVTLEFRVSDEGIGMTPDELSQLFKPFSQADISTTRKFGGTGLGLSISKSLVEMMGGAVRVESEKGVGSSFYVTVPLRMPKGASERHRSSLIDGKRALLVDDSQTARDILREMLHHFGFEVDEAASGEEALEQVEASEQKGLAYDLILMDWKMPGLDGLATIDRLRERYGEKVPTVVMVTAYAREDLFQRSERSGLAGLLIKPVNPSVMFDVVMQIFGDGDSRHTVGPRTDAGEAARALVGSRILVVDDNDINREIAQELLEQVGVEVEQAVNGRDAVTMIARGRYDAVLMDIQMPEMDGLEAARHIREEMKLELPILAMTAHAMVGEREKSLAAGMNDHVTKPIDPHVLYEALAQHMTPSKRNAPVPRGPQSTASNNLVDELVVEGLDVVDGLRRVAGNQGLYVRLLKRFMERQRTFESELALALAAGDAEHGHVLAHTLKGVAGNVGAKPLFERAGELSMALRTETEGIGAASPETLTNLFSRVVEELNRLLPLLEAGLEALENAQKPAVPEPAATSPGEEAPRVTALHGELEHVRSLLAESDSDAIDILEALVGKAAGTPLQAPLSSAHELACEFDFDAALEVLAPALDATAEAAS